MKTDTQGIVLRETKTSYNRRMLLLFTRDYGKISAGTSLGERGKTKSSLALQHFTFGRYTLHQGRSGYNIDSAEVVKSHYGIGENLDKYFQGSYVLEFTGKVLEEDVPMPAVFDLLVDFFQGLEEREKGFGTLVLAYQTKLFNYLGVMPKLDRCAICGKAIARPEEGAGKVFLSVADGGAICEECRREKAAEAQENSAADSLIYSVDFGIIDALKYFKSNSLKKLKNIALTEATGKQLQRFIRNYAAYHLDASNIKSEKMFIE
ncbi:MAG: DNA repair protein RecO [Clostridia bacterium]|nr:DNA repair protein RecO [Clostridia bacterium]